MHLANEESRITSAIISKFTWPGIVLALALAAVAGGCRGEAGVEDEAVRPVKVAVVDTAPRGRTLSYSGVVRPRVESAMGFRVPGKIVERTVNVGDRVELGQVIARLDDTDLVLAENSAKAAVASARTRRDVASVNLERAKPLLPQGFISVAVYDARRNDMDAATSALDTAEAQLRQASNAVGYATLTADKAGIVTAVTAEPGQVVSAGQPVITLADAGETEIAVAVPEQDAGHLAVGQRAKVTLWAGPRVSTEGRIREIAGQADAASRTYAVRIAMNAPPQSMRLGMTASVALRIEEEAAPTVVPLAALTEDGGGPAVFVVDQATQAVRLRPVSVAGVAEHGVKIVSGLQAGDVVVSAGVQFLRDGMRVRLPGERQHVRAASSM
jgi:membrane fusion protein, multidrug efflux system